MANKNYGWIGVDLDGTLAHYDKWRGFDHIGEPVAPMVERVKQWLAEGKKVKIFTARVSGREGFDKSRIVTLIQRWCQENIGQALPVTNIKDTGMRELWDDRAVQVIRNTGTPLTQP